MISKFNLAKALHDHASATCDANAYAFVRQGDSFTSNANTAYVKEHLMFGDDNTVGMERGSSDIQIGVYQLSVMTPRSNEGNRWQAMAMIDVLNVAFDRGLRLIHDGQIVTILNSDASPMDPDDTHNYHAVSIKFSVVN